MTLQYWEDDPTTAEATTAVGIPDEIDVDILVAGGGVGGLMAAYHARALGARTLILGGSSAASNRISSINTALDYSELDTPARLFDDVFRAGGYVNDPSVVAAITNRIGPEILNLEKLGVEFSRNGSQLARRQATGTSWTRAVFSKRMIGVDIALRLKEELAKPHEPMALRLRGGLLIELHVEDGKIIGALAYDHHEDRWIHINTSAVVLSTGGCGQLFGRTTNPKGSVGTGYAIGLETGAELTDMEFVSFEPFVTSAPPNAVGQDLPTTVLREGAKLLNGKGDEFIDTKSAPTKDIICRAMLREVLEGRGTPSQSIYYDLREMDPDTVTGYVQIQGALRSRRMSPAEALLEVMPAQHYMMGGIRIDADSATSVPGLYAMAEVSGGVHGAHRLAASGGMDVVAGGAIAGESAAKFALANPVERRRSIGNKRPDLLNTHLSSFALSRLEVIGKALDDGCGILRNEAVLDPAISAITEVFNETLKTEGEGYLLRSARTALTIAQCARMRAECRGDHYRTDYEARNDRDWLGNLRTTLADDGWPQTSFDPMTRPMHRSIDNR